MNTLLEQIGAEYKAARKSRKLTQEDVADKLGVGRGYIEAFENGKKNATIAQINKLLAALDKKAYFKIK